MSTPTAVAPCIIRDAAPDEAQFCDLVAHQAGLRVPGDRTGARLRIALRDGQVVGFISTTPHRVGVRLDYVFVHHHARRCGIGRTLVADCGVSTRVRIEAHPSSETFFHRIGARREGTLTPDAGNPHCRPVFTFHR